MKTVSITTLGCKSNQYDSSAMEDALRSGGLRLAQFPGPSDAYIINTCTVTAQTDAQSRRLIRRARKLNPDALVIVTGCYAQVSPDAVKRIEGVDYVIGNPEKKAVLDFIMMGRPGSGVKAVIGDYRDGPPFTPALRSSSGRARANLKIQEGCDRACAYCIIPMARGASKSLPFQDVGRGIDALIEAGYAEIVLTGIHLGSYGADLSPVKTLVSVLRLIEERDYPCRFRLSSLDPDEVTDELIAIMKTGRRICNHVHLALQSGDHGILKKMKRHYTAKTFAERVEKICLEVEGAAIGVDVIAGFPGEGEREFENTYALLKDMPLAYLHIFPYSKRQGTAAASYGGQISPKIIRDRCDRLRELDAGVRAAFYNKFIGEKADVIVEFVPGKKTGLKKGRARNYIPVAVSAGDAAPGREIPVRLTGFGATGMAGEAI
ncbi:MAG: tRNA (N(6)-L-threonylcarbamoyladenosine(37)-C(2))-methylthiotransferase MtaB [Deltaproteobacteria bacterium]|nr:tRNA (N(6)-L-threonylcarbamoyladenosine(37)-C(2))-methylthiotransferase MtaB [Deltaproteobacteria bacterium]